MAALYWMTLKYVCIDTENTKLHFERDDGSKATTVHFRHINRHTHRQQVLNGKNK